MISSLVVQFVLSLATLDRQHYGQPSAVVWGDQLLAVSHGRLFELDSLYRGTLKPHERRVRQPVAYWSVGASKVDVRDNRVLLSGTWTSPRIVPFAELGILEDNHFGQKLAELFGYTQTLDYLNNAALCDPSWLVFPTFRKPDVAAPIPKGAQPADPESALIRRQRKYMQEDRIDVQLAGPKTVRLFHAYKDTLFVSIEPDYLNHWRIDPKKWDFHENMRQPPPARELRTGKLPAEFTEYFVAYRAGERDFLVTESGKVFMVEPKGKAELEVT